MDNIFTYFIESPEKEFYIRELARKTKKSPTTISKYLRQLKRGNLVKSEKKFNHILYKSNQENPLYRQKKIFYNIEKLQKSGLIEYLQEQLNFPEAVILYGSFAKGENIKKSDIDILAVSILKKEVNLERFEKILSHKIHLFIHSKNEIEKMKEKNKELLNSFINGTILYGYWELFR